jgi:DNA primase
VPRYAHEVIAEVLAANDIVEIVGSVLELKHAGGRRWKALSPFSNEKTPSFIVSQDRQRYHCFSTDQGGDAISFVMRVEGLTFVEALQKLADRGGVRLPAANPADDREAWLRKQLQEFGKFARNHFVACLQDTMKGSAARRYLSNRGLRDETMQRFSLGYAPDSFSSLSEAAQRKGFKDQILTESGLLKAGRQGSPYDFFRNRVTFPIRDINGHFVAFGGRDLSGESPAKYINSPETRLYKKSKVLYGLYEGRDAVRKQGQAILVEGYFDALRCFDVGIENVVASCGTALTEQQAALIKRYAAEVVMVYDGDAAGIRAAIKGTRVLVAAGLTVRATALPSGQDPDDYIKAEGAEAFRTLVDEAPDFVTFYVRMSADRTGTVEGRTGIAHELFDIFRGIEDRLRIDEYLKLAARGLGLNEWLCRAEYDRFVAEANKRAHGRAAAPEKAQEIVPLKLDEYGFVAALLADEEHLENAQRALLELDLGQGPLQDVLRIVLTGEAETLAHTLEDETAQRLYSAAVNLDEQTPDARKDLVVKMINRLELEALKREKVRLTEELNAAQRGGDTQQAMAVLQRQVKLKQQMEKLGAA